MSADPPVTAANAAEFLEDAARHLSGPYRSDAESWGIPATYRALSLASPEAKRAMAAVLEGFLRSGDPDQARLALTVAGEVELAPGAYLAARERTDLAPEAAAELLTRFSIAVSRGQLPYRSEYRALLAAPDAAPMLGAVAAYDHGYFLAHLPELLGDDPDQAANRLWFGMREMCREELGALRDELLARRSGLAPALAQRLADLVADSLRSGRAGAASGPVRWRNG